MRCFTRSRIVRRRPGLVLGGIGSAELRVGASEQGHAWTGGRDTVCVDEAAPPWRNDVSTNLLSALK